MTVAHRTYASVWTAMIEFVGLADAECVPKPAESDSGPVTAAFPRTTVLAVKSLPLEIVWNRNCGFSNSFKMLRKARNNAIN